MYIKYGFVHSVFKGSQVEICRFYIKPGLSKFNIFLSLKIVFILANITDPDEMPHDEAFDLGPHCLPKHLLTGNQKEKD